MRDTLSLRGAHSMILRVTSQDLAKALALWRQYSLRTYQSEST